MIIKTKRALVFYYSRANKFSLIALAAALETNEFFNDLPVCFLSREKTFAEELRDIVATHEITVAAFSFMTTQLWQISFVVKDLRERYGSRLTLIAGGPHPTGDVQGTLDMGFDVVATGEGEDLFIELLKKMYSGHGVEDVAGIAYLKNGGVVRTGKRTPVNLDKYLPIALRHKKVGPVEVTRGCPFSCRYCQTSGLMGTTPRHRSVDSVCRYVEIMKSKKQKDIRILSPNALSYGSADGKTLNLKKLEELLKSIRKIISNDGRLFWGSFPSEVRPEHVTKETMELIVRYVDNDNLVIGAQAGSQRLLDYCNRSHSVADVYKSVELTIGAGLQANVDFIFGLPGETKEDRELTIRMMKDLAGKGARIHAHTFMPLSQTFFRTQHGGRVAHEMRKEINRLASNGMSYGDWVKQARIAKKIEVYLKTGI